MFSTGIDQALSGNYTCLAKNLYGSDSVVYHVKVLPLPDPPSLRATPYKDSLIVQWDEVRAYSNDSLSYGISKFSHKHGADSALADEVNEGDHPIPSWMVGKFGLHRFKYYETTLPTVTIFYLLRFKYSKFVLYYLA